MKYKFNYFPRDRFWTRWSDDDLTNHVFVVDNKDQSPQWPHWKHGHYDADCSACWLNINHSTDYHNQNE
jgi:hypothetical protein